MVIGIAVRAVRGQQPLLAGDLVARVLPVGVRERRRLRDHRVHGRLLIRRGRADEHQLPGRRRLGAAAEPGQVALDVGDRERDPVDDRVVARAAQRRGRRAAVDVVRDDARARRQRVLRRLAAVEQVHLVPAFDQLARDRGADVAGAADEQNLHGRAVYIHAPPMPYDHSTVEPKWQARWREAGPAQDADRSRRSRSSTRWTCSPTRPAPGCTSGHCEGYTATDVITRWKRMQGFRVLHPMGWDAFGLPAENYAIKHGVHPRVTTAAGDRQLPPPDRLGRLRLRLGARDRHHRSRRTSAGRSGSSSSCTSAAWPTRASSRSTGARRARPAWPTKRSARGAASAAARRSCARTCASGCCGSRATPIGCSPTWTSSTGRRRRWPCSATGSAAARAPRWCSRPRRRSPGARSACSRPAPTRSTARRTWCCRPSTRWSPS